MSSTIRILVRKELLGLLRNPQMIASLVIIPLMFIFMGGIASIGVQKAAEEAQRTGIIIVFLDKSSLAKQLAAAMRAAGFNVVEASTTPAQYAGKDITVIVPKGFAEALQAFIENKTTKPPTVKVVVPVETISITSTSRLRLATSIARVLSDIVKTMYARSHGLPLKALSLNIRVEGEAILHNKKLGLAEAQAIVGGLASSFFVALFVIALSAQYAALSMAQEKEDKSFETLLSQPIPRTSIGLAKTIGALVVTLVQVTLFAASWYYYMHMITSTKPPETIGAETGLETSSVNIYEKALSLIGVNGAVALLLELLIAAIAAALIGLILGGLSRDTRSVGTLLGPLWIIVVGVGMAAQIIGFPSIPETGLLGLTIILGPPIVLQAAVTGNTLTMIITIVSTILPTILLAYLLARILNSEVMIVGLSLRARLRKIKYS